MQASQQPRNILSLSKGDRAGQLGTSWLRGGAWYNPFWALLCGLVASTQFQFTLDRILLVLVALIVAGGLWPALWVALTETDWSAPLGRWRDWREGTPPKPLPYSRPDSPAVQLAANLGYLRDWAFRDLIPGNGGALIASVAAPVAALVLSAVLDEPAMLLTVVAILVPQLALLLCHGDGRPSVLLRGLVQVTLPMLLGFALFAPLRLDMVVAAGGFGLSFAGLGLDEDSWDPRLWNLGQAVTLTVLIVTRHVLGAFLVTALWLPQFMLQAQLPATHTTLRRARWWLLLAMLAAATAL